VRKKYQSKERKSNHKFEIVRGQELLVQVPLPMAEVWAEMQAQVEELTGQAGLQILRAVLENEVTRRVGPPHRPNPTAGCVRWGKQPGYVVFAGQKIPLERPRVRTREGQEVELESYGQLQQDGKLQRAVRERMVAGLSTRNYRRAVESVLEGYGIEKSSVSRQFVAASSNQLRALCERRLEDLQRHHFLGLLLNQPCGQRAQCFGLAAKHSPREVVLPIDFNVGDDHVQHPFMDIDSCDLIGHLFLLPAGVESMPS
jgi:hypothetical protein